MKDAFFLVTDELGWEDRFEANRKFLPNLRLVNSIGTILQSMNHTKSLSTTDLLILIDGDTQLLEASSVISENKPSVFYSTNKYGIKYGHGGVKVLDRNPIPASGSQDITSRMSLSVNKTVISLHEFHFSKFNTWKTLFKELMKLYLWGDGIRLNEWLGHDEPKSVFTNDVIPFIRSANCQDMLTIIGDYLRLENLYATSKSCLSASPFGEDTDSNL